MNIRLFLARVNVDQSSYHGHKMEINTTVITSGLNGPKLDYKGSQMNRMSIHDIYTNLETQVYINQGYMT